MTQTNEPHKLWYDDYTEQDEVNDAISLAVQNMENLNVIVRNCLGCKPWYRADNPDHVFAPRHNALPSCQSGRHPHCTCDICF